MSIRDVKIKYIRDSTDGYSVEAVIDGDIVTHTFPDQDYFFEKSYSETPRYVHELVDIYESKKGTKKSLNSEVESRKHDNREYRVSEKFISKESVNRREISQEPEPIKHEFFGCMAKVI